MVISAVMWAIISPTHLKTTNKQLWGFVMVLLWEILDVSAYLLYEQNIDTLKDYLQVFL